MTPAERGARIGKLCACVAPPACVAIGVGFGMTWHLPAALGWPLLLAGTVALLGLVLLARREVRIVEREEAAEKAPKTPEQIGAEIYALTKKPLTITIVLNPEGRAAVMQLAAKKKIPVDQAWIWAAKIASRRDGDEDA
jgi:hypothetical protein